MSLTPHNRRVITFYSFKGGVGRTMTMANVAYRLANKHGLRVIAVDWDLEAPGLHRFFGISPKKAAKAHGVLDYFAEWREAVKLRDPAPPNVSDWIIPITDKKHKPNFGSLSLLIAGKIDEGYDGRLAALNWQEFYAKGAGASAVETLREQLAGMADVVLIDSRTGFTDAGGICTIQIPDGVVLMTAPNQQSLDGIDRVARGIAKAPKEARAGRDKPRMWLVPSRVPQVEETYLTEQWFFANDAWFVAGINDGIWLREDHPSGFQNHSIPHRGRWGFDEALLNEALKVDPGDMLAGVYDHLAEMLSRWLRGEPSTGKDTYSKGHAVQKPAHSSNIKALEAEVAEAERRGDILGMAASLGNLGVELWLLGNVDSAVGKIEQAGGIFLARGARWEYGRTLNKMGWLLNFSRRYEEAASKLTKALEIARELGNRAVETRILQDLAEASVGKGSNKEAQELLIEGYEISTKFDDARFDAGTAVKYGQSFAKLGLTHEAIKALRQGVFLARTSADSKQEEQALKSLLNLSDAGENLADADALRARLAELKAAPPAAK